jgi:hypothetical protein
VVFSSYSYSIVGVVLREKKEGGGGGTFSKVLKLKKRLSQSFGKLCKYSYA